LNSDQTPINYKLARDSEMQTKSAEINNTLSAHNTSNLAEHTKADKDLPGL